MVHAMPISASQNGQGITSVFYFYTDKDGFGNKAKTSGIHLYAAAAVNRLRTDVHRNKAKTTDV